MQISSSFRRSRVAVAIVVACGLALAAAACSADEKVTAGAEGGGEATPTPGATGPEVSFAPDDIVFSVFVGGGYVPVDVALGEYPELVIMGDGAVTRPAATTAIFPGPALPALEQTTLTADELATIHGLVRASGLFGDVAPDFGEPNITDAATTTIDVTVDGEPRTVSVYALDLDADDVSGLVSPARENRTAVAALVDDVRSLIDDPARGWTVVTPERLVVRSMAYALASDVDPGPPVPWPLEPETIGVPENRIAGCLELEGADAERVIEVAAEATQITRWDAEQTDYQLVFVPWYPTLNGCD
ncbi:MAG: hypothetical protein KDB21_09055 [Acidimicrobiales bacterium]|nr:hypothetical protein [Acidimicrobiales bacterium]